ncbi:melatonin receptor type 1A [Astyanax mexicanus]|uniref:Melatonin receptor type 1A n=1 Tax=Astyanax mexicanus TaxID=7994 RepID=A0A8T2KML3_ASTMX|nr:melatonin receptor type 1A [Astyanax mexicanus]
MGARAARNSVARRERNACGGNRNQRPPWVATTLGCFLIFTIVVDILGNLLVIFSVYRNKKLRNAGKQQQQHLDTLTCARALMRTLHCPHCPHDALIKMLSIVFYNQAGGLNGLVLFLHSHTIVS